MRFRIITDSTKDSTDVDDEKSTSKPACDRCSRVIFAGIGVSRRLLIYILFSFGPIIILTCLVVVRTSSNARNSSSNGSRFIPRGRPTVAMTDIITKVMVKVLTIIGIGTEEISRDKPGGFPTCHINPFSCASEHVALG